MLSMAQLGRIVTDWAGPDRLQSLSTKFPPITPVGVTVTVTGDVIERLDQDGLPILRVQLEAKAGNGATTLLGEALVSAT